MNRAATRRLAAFLLIVTSLAWIAPQTAPAVDAAPVEASRYEPITPTRVLDSRIGLGHAGAVLAGESFDLDVAAKAPAAQPTAVVMNVTVTLTTAPGFITAWPSGEARPTTSVLNMQHPNQTIANLVTVRVPPSGLVSLYSLTQTHLVADIVGFYYRSGAVGAGRFVATDAARVLDTRLTGSPVAAESTTVVDLKTKIPADAVAAVLKVTVTETTAPGHITAFAAGSPRPTASNLNFDGPWQTVPNQVITPLNGARVALYSMSSTHLIVDLVGYFSGASAAASTDGLFVPVLPDRLYDSRRIDVGPGRMVPSGGTAEVAVANRAGIPATGVAAVVLNATLVDSTAPTFVTIYPARTYRPLASSLNASTAGVIFANHAIAPVSSSGFNMYTLRAEHLLADVMGWYTGSPTPSDLPPMTPIPGPSGPPPDSRFVYSAFSGSQPVRWDACRPIRYVVNDSAYPGYRWLIDEALTRIVNATGLTFDDAGTTTLMPTSAFFNPYFSPSDVFPPNADFVIALADPQVTDLVGSGVLGQASYWWMDREYLWASVTVDMEPLHRSGGPWASGYSPGPTLIHELAHAIGLDHVDDPSQVMYFMATDTLTFQAGDLYGLWGLGADQGCIPRTRRQSVDEPFQVGHST